MEIVRRRRRRRKREERMRMRRVWGLRIGGVVVGRGGMDGGFEGWMVGRKRLGSLVGDVLNCGFFCLDWDDDSCVLRLA